MAIRPIRILGEAGDEVLRQVASSVDQIDGSVQNLIDDMLETMRDAPGVGLAAPQVGVPLRIVVIEVPEVPAFALINGEVIRHSGSRWLEEGCLSIPGYRGELFRSVKVQVKGLDRKGRPIRIRAADDLLAQALEHEIDHTQGLLYVDLMDGAGHLHRIPAREDEEVMASETEGYGLVPSQAAPPRRAPVARRFRHGAPPRMTARRASVRTRRLGSLAPR